MNNRNAHQKNSPPQRLKRKDLVMGVLYWFSELYETSQAETIWDITIPIEELRTHLKERFGVEYKSNQWVFTQLRRYEDEIGAKLFEKTSMKNANSFDLLLHPHMIEFVQKQHLHVPQKIKAANGVYDKIASTSEGGRNVRVCLGAGSTIYHLAQIFIERQKETQNTYTLYTHNAGILPMLFSQHVDHAKLSVASSGGFLDPITRTILGDPKQIFQTREFDFIIQGTSLIYEGNLFIESEKEKIIKSELLHGNTGCKVLVLTKHEFQDEPIEGLEPYGTIADYDYLVVPRTVGNKNKKRYDLRFDQYKNWFDPEIMNWNYSIVKLRK